MPRFRFHLLACVGLVLGASLASALHPVPRLHAAQIQYRMIFPLMMSSLPPNPFGFDLRTYSSDATLLLGSQARPKWARAGDVDWAAIEPVKGEYHWELLASFEANVRRLHAAGIEPVGIVQRSPPWAQSVAGRFCSPPKPEAIANFADFTYALAARFSQGDLAVNYWEIWNEPDYSPGYVQDSGAVGCWGNSSAADNGGSYYGQVLNKIYPAIKYGNNRALVFAGALASFGLNDNRNERFLRGMLATAPGSFDALSFHAYGEWSQGDLLVYKTNKFRTILNEYQLGDKPLIATEVAATCGSNLVNDCKPDYSNWVRYQANYAARIYAEALALDLMGAFWFTLDSQNPGFAYSHLVDVQDNKLVPRPAFYAFRTSAQLLQGAHYVGPPLVDPPPSDSPIVQVLKFRKANSTLYVLWVPRLDYPTTYRLPVQAGAVATCTQRLDAETPINYYCSDTDKNGIIPVGINALPIYVEVQD